VSNLFFFWSAGVAFGGGFFRASCTNGIFARFNLPLGTNKKFAKNLNKILPLASGRSVRCVKVSRDSQVADQANWNPPKWDALILAPEDE
jgi:hypothetical protein